MGQHFTLGAGPVQIMGQHVLPRLYGCRLLWSVLDVCVLVDQESMVEETNTELDSELD